MNFEDLTDWDVLLIKDLAVNTLVNTRINNRYEALADVILGCVKAKGFNLTTNIDAKFIADKLTPFQGYGAKAEVSSVDVMKQIFEFIRDQNIGIVKDETREPTWCQPNNGWYHRVKTYKQPWVM